LFEYLAEGGGLLHSRSSTTVSLNVLSTGWYCFCYQASSLARYL